MAANSGSPVATWNFTLKAGANTSITMTWSDDNDQPMNLTGYTMEMVIRAFVGSPVALLTLSSQSAAGSRIVLGGTAGTIELIFAAADTVNLHGIGLPLPSNPGLGGLPVSRLGVYDLQYTDPNGEIDYLLEGSVSLDPWVTE